ncbi:MAG: hypothetical protein R3288_00855 [Woeseiaceae bacterium]|nr:hypothetical protein [Woeseiaceae bacterium]
MHRRSAWRLLAAAALATACGEQSAEAPSTSGFLPANTAAAGDCIDDGRLRTALYGALNGELAWTGAAMQCEGMPRPDGRGARLRFAGPADASQIAIIIALPDLDRAQTGAELASNVTLIEEGSGRFFSTPDLSHCWTDVLAQTPIDTGNERYAIGGRLYCIAPLVEVNGSGSVSIDELEFTGRVDWSGS